GLCVQLGTGAPETIRLPKEESDGEQEADDGQEARAYDARVAAREAGPGRDGASTVPDDSVGLERGVGGDGRHRGGADIARDLLQPRGAGAEGDAGGAGAGRRGGTEREPGGAHRGAGEEGRAARTGEEARRALALLDAQDAEE